MIQDEIVSQVQKVRKEHAKRFDFNLDRIAKDIKKGEKLLKKEGWTFVSKPYLKKISECTS
jgi:hypothetical protein